MSTLGEAKFYADHGFCDILYAAPIVPAKLERIDAILRGEDGQADVHFPSFKERLSSGQVPGLTLPLTSSLSPQHPRKSPLELGVSIAILIDSEFGFEVVKTKLRQNQRSLRETPHITPSMHPVKLWLDIDGGYHRTGMNYADDSDVARLLQSIASSLMGPNAEFKSASHVHDQPLASATCHFSEGSSKDIQVLLHGLYYHGGNSYGAKTSSEIESYAEKERDAVRGMKVECEAVGLKFGSLAVGSTPTCSQPPSDLHPINEFHPGNYIFYDSWQAMIGSCDWEKNASWVLAQVISAYTKPDRIAFDAGALALSKDLGATHVRDEKKASIERRRTSSSSLQSAQAADGSALAAASSEGPYIMNQTKAASSKSVSTTMNDSSSSLSSLSSSPMSSHPSPLGGPSSSSSSAAAPAEFGLLTQHSDLLYLARITQEMGIIQVRPEHAHRSDVLAHTLMTPGQHFRIIPNHSCLSAACFPSLFIVHGDSVVDEWFTAPRIW